MPTCMRCSHTVVALILLYGGYCFSVWLSAHSFPHHFGLPASHNNVPQPIMMFPDSVIAD